MHSSAVLLIKKQYNSDESGYIELIKESSAVYQERCILLFNHFISIMEFERGAKIDIANDELYKPYNDFKNYIVKYVKKRNP